MLFRGGGGRGGAAGAAAAAGMNLVRHFSRKCGPDLRTINPKVPKEEAKEISQSLYQIIKEQGPLSVANTWNHAKPLPTFQSLYKLQKSQSYSRSLADKPRQQQQIPHLTPDPSDFQIVTFVTTGFMSRHQRPVAKIFIDFQKEAGISGLGSKTHMKIMLKWMGGKKMLKLFCTRHGSAKRFLHSTLPEDPRLVQEETVVQAAIPSDSLQPSMRQEKKRLKKLLKRQKMDNDVECVS